MTDEPTNGLQDDLSDADRRATERLTILIPVGLIVIGLLTMLFGSSIWGTPADWGWIIGGGCLAMAGLLLLLGSRRRK